MKLIKTTAFILTLICIRFAAQSQDTLPNFNALVLNQNMVQISWKNNFKNIVQLTVQRSLDSTSHFKTIFSAESPELPENGLVDKKVPSGFKVYYRIQYVLENGTYYFTKSKQAKKNAIPLPVITNTKPVDKPVIKEIPVVPVIIEKPLISIYKKTRDSLINRIEYAILKKFKDSVARYTKDTMLINEAANEIIIKPFVPKPIWKPSLYLFINENDLIQLSLPMAKKLKYRILFFDEKGKSIFQIDQPKETDLIIDKSNFRKAGWVIFELFENDLLIEKNKFFLRAD